MKNILGRLSVDALQTFARRKLNSFIFRVRKAFGVKRKTARPGTIFADNGMPSRSLLDAELVIFAGVPYDDIGGGQRSAQIARCALKSGRRVFYLYAYPRYDFAAGASVESDIAIPCLTHLNVIDITPAKLFSLVSVEATLIFELPHPLFLPFLDFARMRGLRTVYELIDEWDSSLGCEWFEPEVHWQFITHAEIVSGTAKVLCEQLQTLGRADALYLPNAANEKIFDQYRTYPVPQEYEAYSDYRNRLIYFGSLYGEWFGWDYIRQAAEDNPESGFFLVGDYCGGMALPGNIHMLGPRLIEELPPYLAHADAALIPFVPGKISDAVSPIKVFEYIFMGKPVVATALPEIHGYPGVFTARDVGEFSEYCRSIDSFSIDKSGLDRFIAGNCWHARIANILPTVGCPSNVTAIFLIHNNATIIGRALESLIQHCSVFLKEIIVVDNASSDGGGDLVRELFPKVTVIRSEINGCSRGRNLALSHATGKYVAFFDSDQWFTSGAFLPEALAILQKHAAVAAVGWGAGWFSEDRGDLSGPIVDDLTKRGMDTLEAVVLGFRTDIAYLQTCGMIVPRKIVQQTNGFDCSYDPTCFEDTDFSFQLKSLGYLLAYRDLTGIQHQSHQTTNASSSSPEYLQLFRKNARYFKKKWSSHPEFFVDCPEQYWN